MKILIVDDEAVSRVKLEAILGEFGECRAASGGREAILEVKKALQEEEPFDLITMDIEMPEIDGTEALFEIRQLEGQAFPTQKRKAKIIMITAQKDRDSLITCVQAGCDDYIIKPFDPDLVLRRLRAQKLPGLEEWDRKRKEAASTGPQYDENDKVAIGREALNLFRRGEISLPSPSDLFSRFQDLVEQGADLARIADLLKEDVGISFHLISVSNSPIYRGVAENRNIHEAIGRLGLELTTNYVNLLGNRSLFTIVNKSYQPIMDDLWKHSVACAHAAEILTRKLELRLEHDPFTLGILHDVGKMILVQIVSELEERGRIGRKADRARVVGTLEAYHGPFGEAILNQWNFHKDFGLIAKKHDDLTAAADGSLELAVVQMANLISKSAGYGYDESMALDPAASPPAARLGLDADGIEQVQTLLAEKMEETQKAME